MTRLFTIPGIWILAILLGGSIGLATTSAQGVEPAFVGPESDADVADGAALDTLRACRARIPKDASIGQRMIAEQGCWRDENNRKGAETVPSARSTGLREPAKDLSGFEQKNQNRIVKLQPTLWSVSFHDAGIKPSFV
jgi:hypothetical protein